MKNRRLHISGTQVVLILALVIITVLFSLINPNYFSYANLINILVASASIGLTANGLTLLQMLGMNDLSAGAVAAASGVFMAWMLKNTAIHWSIVMLLALIFAAIAGLLNGLMVTKLRIVPFIATLASQSVWRGVAYLICNGKPIATTNPGLSSLAKGRVFGDNGIPIPVLLMLIFFVIFSYVLAKTTFGRKIFAIGGNAEAARLAGINSDRIKVICFVITSAFAGLSGVILTGRMNSGNPAASPNLHFDVITAANLGGVSMVGGVGSMPSVLLGVLLVQAFNSGLNMAQVSAYWQYVARGLLLFSSLAIDFYRQRTREKKLLNDSMRNL